MKTAGGHERKVCGLYEMERARKATGVRWAEGTRPIREIALAKNMVDEVREDGSVRWVTDSEVRKWGVKRQAKMTKEKKEHKGLCNTVFDCIDTCSSA